LGSKASEIEELFAARANSPIKREKINPLPRRKRFKKGVDQQWKGIANELLRHLKGLFSCRRGKKRGGHSCASRESLALN